MKKILFPLLLASLALNAAFALVFGLGSAAEPPAVATPAPPAASSPIPPPLTADIWPGLQTDDLPALVARLRAAGFPPEMIRALLTAQISQSFAARRKALEPPADRVPFWQAPPFDPKIQAALQQLQREQRKALQDLLGDDPDEAVQRQVNQGIRLDFLSAEKAGDLRRILRDAEERREEVYASRTNDQEKLAAIERAQREAIVAALTPAELLEYDLRNSDTARQLRTSLSAFSPTEEEFRAIVQLRQPFDEKYKTNGLGLLSASQEVWRQRNEAEKQLTTQIKAALAPERAAEYDRAVDNSFRQTSQLVARLDLPAETATQLWTLQKDFERRRNELYQSNSTSGFPAALAALNAEALAKVTPLLGQASRIETYKQYGGAWLTTLTPRPAPR